MLNLPDGVSHPPVVLNLHGFGGSLSGYKYAHTHLARVLEANGIACLRFDFYGCGESDGEFEEMTFTGLLEDTQDVYEWLKGQDFVDTDKNHLIRTEHGRICRCYRCSKVESLRTDFDVPGCRNVEWM